MTQLFWLCVMENHSIYVLTPLSRPWWWNQPTSIVYQIRCALSQMCVRVTISMLTLRWPVSRLWRPISCCHLSKVKTADRRRLNATYVRHPCRTYYAHLSTDARSHQFESVTVDIRWTDCTYLKTCGLVDFGMCFLFSAVRDARSQARNCNQIQTKCSLFSSPFVPSYSITINSHTLL